MRESAYIINIKLEHVKECWPVKESADEIRELVLSTGCSIKGEDICRLKKVNPHCFIGEGKVQEIALEAKGSDVVIFSHDLSAAQQQNIEDVAGIKTIDRTQLILDVFARHARSSEGKLQVELAQLNYLLPRLKGKGIMLSRLGGGIGTRGPGEKKLEIDRRKIRRRIEKLKEELESVKSRRLSLRKKRKQNEIPLVVLIGYTNAGKTTLLNALTDSTQASSESMFTTLDPVSRIYTLPSRQKIIFADTVGFLNDLPYHLIDSFRATLEEINEADLILHVLDISHHLTEKRKEAVYSVLNDLGVHDKKIITVFNKIDKAEHIDRDILSFRYPDSVFISALKSTGISGLVEKIKEALSFYESWLNLFVPDSKISILEMLGEENIIERKPGAGGVYIKARVPLKIRENFCQKLKS
ncbi:MAG TPA: GTPase HflX [Candidatus Omnitrophica bacterium]|nr:GTPase HflX [Candidatus Omnitrophota bacterium]